ncbi:MAG: sigma-54-dependent Fis family transcriptional regulator [Halothiobacillus sp. 15-55-196]|jgi:DNA-binding NtrC family response regulator|uniref:sigma-54-dependent transcriptional regulator n=1 Tax=Halothiobacillus sp. 15-55-196 TaxID=1970382 RepID=UPI000BDCE74A|nr:sigma-54 dependent transcriptional regulator [Halothiobacillus sp. 15-55-196]OZB35566.1 MAG: sigma-54-dependent Fis family transcriptional regulator [Halothiobacillus sp. 15-55-196]OZB77705.1 MAG: sigma-54-dependent Fis family transcriptional regulator [Halothiobacillus sp. 13-55-115]
MTETRKLSERVLIVEDNDSLCGLLEEELCDAGYVVGTATTAEAAWEQLSGGMWGLVISDLRLPGADGLTLLRQTQQLPAPPAFIMITAFGRVDQAVAALKEGADEFLVKPVDLEHLLFCVRRVSETRHLRQELARFRTLFQESDFHGMIGRSPAMQVLYAEIKQIARASGPVLITGESGVGKELVARALHQESERINGPLVPVNCAGIPAELLESELFGHASGAFTGAQRARRGLISEADGGTLLLDEIGELPMTMQAKLLRVLQDQRIRPVGSNQEQSIDLRVIAATNRDLEAEVEAGSFREDLFYRLNTFTLKVPPLRERGEDLTVLAAHFINRFSTQLGHQINGLNSEAVRLLSAYPFPGNIRELANAMERAATFCPDSEICAAHLPETIRQATGTGLDPALAQVLLPPSGLPALDEIEQRYINHVLKQVRGNKRRAATILGISRRTLYRRLGEDESKVTDGA